MPTPLDILKAVVIPSAVALVLMVIGTRAWRRSKDPGGLWSVPLAIGIAVAISLFARRSFAGISPAMAQDWLWHVTGITIACGVLVSFLSRKVLHWIVPAALACAAASYLLLRYRLNPGIDGTLAGVMLPGIAMIAASLLFHLFLRDARDWSVSLCFALCAMCLGGAVGFTGSQDFAMIAAALGGALLSVTIASWVRPVPVSPVVTVPTIVFFGSLLALSHYLANLNDQREFPLNTTLFALAFVLAASPGLSRFKPLTRAAIRVSVVLIPLLFATIPAAIAFFSKPQSPYDGLYSSRTVHETAHHRIR